MARKRACRGPGLLDAATKSQGFVWRPKAQDLENGQMRSPSFGEQQWCLRLKKVKTGSKKNDRIILDLISLEAETMPVTPIQAKCTVKVYKGLLEDEHSVSSNYAPGETLTFTSYAPTQKYAELALESSSENLSTEYRIEANVQKIDKENSLPTQKQFDILKTCLQRHLTVFDDPRIGDVVFVFDAGTEQEKRLYSTKGFLSECNEHFSDMFSPSLGFKESCEPEESGTQTSNINQRPATEIPINGTSYRTYSAMLWWLASGEIEFACPTMISQALYNTKDVAPTFEPEGQGKRALPEEMFVLADIYGIDDLKELALEAISNCLAPITVLYLLFSDMVAYNQVRDLVKRFVGEHWDEIKKSPAYKEIPSHLMGATSPQILLWHEVVSNIGPTKLPQDHCHIACPSCHQSGNHLSTSTGQRTEPVGFNVRCYKCNWQGEAK